jgi:hypothetical protein
MPSHKAILTGYNWNSEPTLVPQRTPIFLTYSFATMWSDERFGAADQKLARYSLKRSGGAGAFREDDEWPEQRPRLSGRVRLPRRLIAARDARV